jgi:hypothetical protein
MGPTKEPNPYEIYDELVNPPDIFMGDGTYPHSRQPTDDEVSALLGQGRGNESTVMFALPRMELSDLEVMANAALAANNPGRAGMVAGIVMMRASYEAENREASQAALSLAAMILQRLEQNPKPLAAVSELYN